MELQRIQVKVFLDRTTGFSIDPFIAILDDWRREPVGFPDNEWIDFVDYAHVQDGPGVVLVGRSYNISADMGDGEVAMMFRGRRGLTGTDDERFAFGLRAAHRAAIRALADPRCTTASAPMHATIELSSNDRLDFAAGDVTSLRLLPAMYAVLDRAFGQDQYTTRLLPASAHRFGVVAVSSEPRALASLNVDR